MHVCMCVCMLCVRVRMHACMYVCLYVCIREYRGILLNSRVRELVRMCIYVCMYVCMYVLLIMWKDASSNGKSSARDGTNSYIQTCMHAWRHTYAPNKLTICARDYVEGCIFEWHILSSTLYEFWHRDITAGNLFCERDEVIHVFARLLL